MAGIPLVSAVVLWCCWGALSLGLTPPVAPTSLLSTFLFWRESPKEAHFIQSIRPKRRAVGELVRAQPHLVHDMGWPEIYQAAPPIELANSSQLNTPLPAPLDVVGTGARVDGLDKEEDMEHMLHLAAPRQTDDVLGHPEEAELAGVDVSNEASGFNGMDTEERGEEGGEDQERRGELEWIKDREKNEEEVLIEENQMVDQTDEDIPGVTHSTTDPHVKIDFAAVLHPSTEPGSSFADADPGLEEFQASPLLKLRSDGVELKEDDVQSSGYEAVQPTVPSAAADVSGRVTGTFTIKTETDLDLLGSYTREEMEAKEERGTVNPHPTEPEAAVNPSREPLQPAVQRSGEDGRDSQRNTVIEETRIPSASDPPSGTDQRELLPDPREPQQVVCLSWSELAGRGYVILNMTDNMNCEDFRAHQGVQLLKIIERVFSHKMKSPEGSWVLYLSKPTHHHHQLLMNVASGHGVIASQEVLEMLGQIRRSLNEVGIQNYSAASACQPRRSQSRSDYGKLFVVLVIIGAVCLVIITSGIIYICWQRRLPAAKTVFRTEELHHVENGYHDNPTLDVTNDSEAEMQEKKPSTNGLAGGGGGEDRSHWQGFINQAVTEEDEGEQDTHL